MLSRKSPETLADNITIKGYGENYSFPIVYHNRTNRQIADENKRIAEANEGKDDAWLNRELFVYVVASIDGVAPTNENVERMEEEWPGALVAIIQNYHEMRRVQLVKN